MRLPTDLRARLESAYREGYGRDITPDEADALGVELLEMFGRALTAILRHELSTDPGTHATLTTSATNETLATKDMTPNPYASNHRLRRIREEVD